MKKRAIFVIALLMIAALVPMLILKTRADVSAGPNQQVYTGDTVTLNGTTTENVSAIVQVTWDFGDNSTPANGTTAAFLDTTHVYAASGVYNATLTVKFDATLNKTESATAQITVLQNTPPVANAGPNQFVEQTSPQGANVTLDGTASYDPDNDTLTFNWTWTGGSATGATPTVFLPPGNTTVTLTVSDGHFNSTATVVIEIRDTTPPTVAISPNDLTVEQESHAGTEVTLNGTATDAVSRTFNFTWTENNTTLKTDTNTTSTTLTHTFNLGKHLVTLYATDQAGNTGNANATVTVIDTRPPEMNLTATPKTLWPPNHKYVEVKINASVFDICDPNPTVTLVSATSNEPDNGLGDGNTVNDIIVVNNFTLMLRAERSGTGDGRIYSLTYKATDASGNFVTKTVKIEVPHNQ